MKKFFYVLAGIARVVMLLVLLLVTVLSPFFMPSVWADFVDELQIMDLTSVVDWAKILFSGFWLVAGTFILLVCVLALLTFIALIIIRVATAGKPIKYLFSRSWRGAISFVWHGGENKE